LQRNTVALRFPSEVEEFLIGSVTKMIQMLGSSCPKEIRSDRFETLLVSQTAVGTQTIATDGPTAWVKFVGQFTAADVEDFLTAFRREVDPQAVIRFVVGDTTAVTGTASDIHKPSQSVLKHFKQRGVEELLIVMPNPILGMIVRTTAFVSGLPTRVMTSNAAARDYVQKKLGQTAARAS